MMRISVILLAFTLAACGSAADDDGVGGVSAGEAKALNEAAAMLDARVSANMQALEPYEGPNAAQ